jgi:hypothetical protein
MIGPPLVSSVIAPSRMQFAAWADPTLREVEKGRRHLFEDEIAKLLDEARASGELVACDPARLGRTLLTALTGAALLWASDADRALEDRLVEVFDEIVGPYLAARTPAADGRTRD